MSDDTISIEEELPAPSPVTSLIAAMFEANVSLIADLHGQKAALRWVRRIEANLSDNVVPIRGEESCDLAQRNRRTALNWIRRLLPRVIRRLKG